MYMCQRFVLQYGVNKNLESLGVKNSTLKLWVHLWGSPSPVSLSLSLTSETSDDSRLWTDLWVTLTMSELSHVRICVCVSRLVLLSTPCRSHGAWHAVQTTVNESNLTVLPPRGVPRVVVHALSAVCAPCAGPVRVPALLTYSIFLR